MANNHKIKILFITHYAKLYGANRSLLDILKGLQQYNIEPIVLAPEFGELNEKLKKLEISFFVVPFKMPFEYRWKSRYLTFQFIHNGKHLLNSIFRNIYNAKCLNSIIQNSLIDDIQLIYSNTSVMTIGEDISKTLNLPHIHQIRELPEKQFHLKPDFGTWFYLKKLKLSNMLIFNSQFTKNNFLNTDKNISSIVNYNEITKPKIVDAITIKDKALKIGIFGYLSEQKNQKEAIKAISLIKSEYNIRLFVIGGGEIEKYQAFAKALNVSDKISFVGYTDNIGAYYDAMDIVVVSAINEALGRVTVEAMLYIKPVIGKNSGATPELIRHNKNGLLYNSARDLANNIELLYCDPRKRIKLALQGNLYAVTNFSSGLSIERLWNEITNLVE